MGEQGINSVAKWVFVYTNKKVFWGWKGRESKIKKLKIERRKERGKGGKKMTKKERED